MNNNVWRWFLLSVCCLFPLCGFAQNVGSVRGVVTDQGNSSPMEYVTVRVLEQPGNKLVKGTITDVSGAFRITGLAAGNYRLLLTYTGYDSLSKDFTVTAAAPDVRLRQMQMRPLSKQLKGVNVVTQQSQMTLEVDKKVFNVGQDLTKSGSSASELLETIPSVEVDNEGGISLRGNTNVTIWIDGKPSGLTADNQGQILEQMPAENIDRIEVITNPSAKYSPEGTTGIINIILKKDKRKGYYGSIQAGANTDDRGNLGGSLSGNINYNSGKWDLYANIGLRNHVHSRTEHTYRDNLDADGNKISYLNQDAVNTGRGLFCMLRGGATYHLGDKDNFSLDLMGNIGSRGGSNSNIYTSNVPALYDTSWRVSEQDNRNTGGSASLSYRHLFSKESTLDLLASYNRWNMEGNNLFTQTYDRNYLADTTLQRQESSVLSGFWTFQADYANKFSENMRLEAGYKGELQQEESPVSTFNGRRESELQENYQLYNDFFYSRDVHALYGTFSHKIKSFSYQLGLRGEYTSVETQSLSYGQSRGTAPVYDTSYFNFFPSIFLSYALPHGHEFQLNYTRRISRPRGHRLNPFVNLEDTMNISFGNPYLLPEYSNSLEFNYLKKWNLHTLSLSLYHRNTDNMIQRIRYRDNQVMKSTFVNVAHEGRTGLELISKNTLFKMLDLTTTFNFYYNEMDSFTYWPQNAALPVTAAAEEDFSWNVRMLASLALPKGFMLQLTGRYDAPRLVAQGERMANYSLDAGLRKSFFNKKLSMNLNVRDLFNTQSWHTITSGDGFYQDYEGHWGRHIRLMLTYQFGNTMSRPETKRPQDTSNGYEDTEEM